MMKNSIIIGLVLGILFAIFAVQNNISTDIKLFFWTVYGSKSLIMLLVFITGILSGVLLCIPIIRKRNKTIHELKSEDNPISE